MSNILITGGAGYIGSHTLISLLEAGHTPIVVDTIQIHLLKASDESKKLPGNLSFPTKLTYAMRRNSIRFSQTIKSMR